MDFRKHSLLERNCWIGQTPIVTLTAQLETLKPLVCGLAIILTGRIAAAPYQGFSPEAATNKNGSQARTIRPSWSGPLSSSLASR